MDNIFNQIKKRFNQMNETPATEEQWNSFAAYRHEKLKKKNKRIIAWPLLALLSLLLLSLGANALLVSNINTEHIRLDYTHSTDTIYIIQETSFNNINNQHWQDKLDSTFNELSMLINDQNKAVITLQQNAGVPSDYAVSSHYRPLENLTDLFERHPSAYKLILADMYRGSESFFNDSLTENYLIQKNQNRVNLNENGTNANLSTLVDPLAYLTYQPLAWQADLSKRDNRKEHFIWPTRKQTFLNRIKPKTFSMGAFAALNYPVNYRYQDQIGGSYGVVFSSMFSSKIRGNVMLGSYTVNGKSQEMGGATGVPEIVLSDNQILEYVKIKQTGVLASIGFAYIFSQGNIFRPFVGLAFGLSFKNQDRYNYEILSLFGEHYEKRRLDRATMLQFGTLTAGFDCRLSPRVNMHLAFDYLLYEKTVYPFPNRYRVRPSLLYHF